MNRPFQFAAASANDILDLTDTAANLILAALLAATLTDAQRQRFALLPPLNPGWITSLTLSANKDATVQFGVNDVTAAQFVPVYTVQLLAAGTSAVYELFDTGLYLPLGGAVHPALKVVVGTTVILAGQIEVRPDFANNATPFNAGGFGIGLLGNTRE